MIAAKGLVPTPVRQLAADAKAASRVLASLDELARNQALERMAEALTGASDILLAANAEDLRRVESFSEPLPPATLSRLKLTPAKLADMVEQIRSVVALPDPLGRQLDALELDQDLKLTKISVPLGVLAVIFEARPDAVTQIAALSIKSGNAVLLKPGSEVERTAIALLDVLQEALRSTAIPRSALGLVLGRERTAELLGAHDLIDLVIPRGSRQLVEYVQQTSRIPVLGHAEGICHIFVDRAADPELALRVIGDAKLDYPAACNAVETVLVHHEIAPIFVPQLVASLQKQGIRLHGDATVRRLSSEALEPVADWHTEFGAPELAVGVVDSLEAAIAHIHRHGSAHTESILTQDPAAAERFLREVDAAGVYHNVSTRFADGFRYGFGAEVGVSTSKLHARGPVGLDGLTTYKYLLRGTGQIVADYRGSEARAFTHRGL